MASIFYLFLPVTAPIFADIPQTVFLPVTAPIFADIPQTVFLPVARPYLRVVIDNENR